MNNKSLEYRFDVQTMKAYKECNIEIYDIFKESKREINYLENKIEDLSKEVHLHKEYNIYMNKDIESLFGCIKLWWKKKFLKELISEINDSVAV